MSKGCRYSEEHRGVRGERSCEELIWCWLRTKELRTEERRRAVKLNEVVLNRLGIKVEKEKMGQGRD